MTNTFQQALQEKPSQMITYALGALEEAEAVPHYRIDMGYFHFSHGGNTCYMCIGGAAAIKRAGMMGQFVDIGLKLATLESEHKNRRIYERALDRARTGDVGMMFEILGLDWQKGSPFDRPITRYSDNPTAFKVELRQLAADLAAAGY